MNDSAAKTGLSCVTKAIIMMVVIPLLLVLAVVVWWFSRQSVARGRLDRTLAQLRADGLPHDVVSLQNFYDGQTKPRLASRWMRLVEASESPPFVAAAKAMPFLGNANRTIPAPSKPWPDEDAVRSFLANQQSIFDEIADLQDQTAAVRYPIGFGAAAVPGPDTKTRTLSRLLALRHRVAIRDADSAEATDSILGLIAVARSMEGRVSIMTQLIRLACLGQAVDEIRQGLAADVYDAEGLRRMQIALSKRSDAAGELQLAIQGERAFMLNAFQTVRSKMPMSPAASAKAILEAVTLYGQYSDAVVPDVYASVTEIQLLADQFATRADNAGLVGSMDMALVPRLGPMFLGFSQTEAQCRLAETAIAVRLYHHANNAWPDRLASLSDIGFSADTHRPPGGKPFGYRVSSDGSVLVWGFPLRPTTNLPAMTETPDQPPFEADPDENVLVYQLSSPTLIANP